LGNLEGTKIKKKEFCLGEVSHPIFESEENDE
jgi:hypothetical protein